MIVVPAIDIRAGRCVPAGAPLGFSDDPGGCAEQLAEAGAQRVQLTNLDAARGHEDARSRRGVRAALELLRDRGVYVQIASGIRSHSVADFWLESGATNVIVSNLAVYRPDLAMELCTTHPGRVLLGLDVRDDVVHPEGWARSAGSVTEHLLRWSRWPAAGLIRTNLAASGKLTTSELEVLKRCAEAYPRPVMANAITDSLADLAQCAAAGVAAAVIGRNQCGADLDLREAIALFPGSDMTASAPH